MNHHPVSRRTALKIGGASLFAAASARLLAEPRGEVPTAHESIRRMAEDAPLSMRFEGKTKDECLRWQESFAAKLRGLLGEHRPPKSWKTTVEERAELEDHTRLALVLSADGFPELPIYLLIPRGETKRKRPGMVALHGHGAAAYDGVAGRDDLPGVAEAIESANYDFGRQFVRRGYVVAAPCMTPFGRRLESRDSYGGEDPCAVTFVRLQLLGRLLMAENLRDALWAVELLAGDERVDAARLGCAGLSYGGRMTMLTAALEPRIKAAVISGALNLMQERVAVRYSCGAQVIPGLLNYGDVPEIGSLIAPRTAVWEAGLSDGLIKPAWAKEAIERMRRAYGALDADEQLVIDRFDGGHRFSGRLAFDALANSLQPAGE